MQSIDANVTEDGGPVRYYAELPRKADTATEWLENVNARRDTLTLTVRLDAVMPDIGGGCWGKRTGRARICDLGVFSLTVLAGPAAKSGDERCAIRRRA